MIKKEKDSLCVNCPSMGLECQGGACPYSNEYLSYRECDKCGQVDALGYYNVNGEELCTDCAFDKLSNFNDLLRFIEEDKCSMIDFYFNHICGCHIPLNENTVSDKALEIIRKECLEFPNMMYDELKEYCKGLKPEFLEWCGLQECDEVW